MKIVANLKDKMIENKECQWVTKVADAQHHNSAYIYPPLKKKGGF